MGNYTSKFFTNYGDNDSKSKLHTHNGSANVEKHQCTPIMTRKCLSADPRSATVGIVRTPIEMDSTPIYVSKRTASAVPKYLQMKPYLETDIDKVIDTLSIEHQISDPRSPNVTCQRTPIVVKSQPECLTSVVKLNTIAGSDIQQSMSGLDPRSPAINFDRTPIMKPKSPGNIEKVSHDHVAKCDTEPLNLQMSYCETTTNYNIPEIQALPEIILCTPLVLEKRLDAINTTSEENILRNDRDTDVSLEESDSEEQITVIPNVNSSMNHNKSLKIDVIDDKDMKNEFTDTSDSNSVNIMPKLMRENDENGDNNGKIRVWRDSISPTTSTELNTEVFKTTEEIIIEFDDDQSILKSHNKLDGLADKTDENKIDNLSIGKKQQLQPLNKDIKFIYDDTKEYNTNGIAAIDTKKSRPPLGNRSNNHKPEVLTKSPQQLLKNKVLNVILQQQENTPPRIKRGKSKNKTNATQWDLDKTVVI